MVMRALARSPSEQDVLGPVDAGGQIRRSADIGVHALDQAAMGGSDLVCGCTLGQSQDGQRLVARHVGPRTRWRGPMAVAPVRAQPAIEIGFEDLQGIGI